MACPSGTRYDPEMHQCRTVIYLTDLNQDVLVQAPQTLSAYQQQQQQIMANNLTEACPSEKPFTNNGR